MAATVEFIQTDEPEKELSLCVAVRRHYDRGATVAVLAADEAQGETLMTRLWTFAQQAFIPHAWADSTDGIAVDRVLVTADEGALPAADVLVLGRPCDLSVFGGYETVVDFAEVHDEGLRQAARERFAACKEAGFAMRFVK